MRTIETTVYKFNELSEDAKNNAIEQIREQYYQYNDFAEWAKDDDYLLNPKYEELKKYNMKDGILLSNSRKKLYFSCDREWYLDCAEAINVENEEVFMDWLGFTPEQAKKLLYRIYTPSGRNSSTTIEFELNDSEDDEIDTTEAEEKFNNHINDCLRSLEANIDFRYTDEAIIENIEANDYEFTEEGKLV
jgi:hypothetical protein